MALETGLVALLNAAPAVTALISTRVFGGSLPIGCAYPAVVYQVSTTRNVNSVQGTNKLRFKGVQFDSYGSTYESALQVSNTILATVTAAQSTTLPDGTAVQGCIVEQDRDMPYEQGNDGFIFRRMLEITIQHVEQ
jgi:hypothetical protein